MLPEADVYCDKALKQSPDNEEMKKLAKQIHQQKSENERREAEISKAVAAAKVRNFPNSIHANHEYHFFFLL